MAWFIKVLGFLKMCIRFSFYSLGLQKSFLQIVCRVWVLSVGLVLRGFIGLYKVFGWFKMHHGFMGMYRV